MNIFIINKHLFHKIFVHIQKLDENINFSNIFINIIEELDEDLDESLRSDLK